MGPVGEAIPESYTGAGSCAYAYACLSREIILATM
jgi:hypothetical protein